MGALRFATVGVREAQLRHTLRVDVDHSIFLLLSRDAPYTRKAILAVVMAVVARGVPSFVEGDLKCAILPSIIGKDIWGQLFLNAHLLQSLL